MKKFLLLCLATLLASTLALTASPSLGEGAKSVVSTKDVIDLPELNIVPTIAELEVFGVYALDSDNGQAGAGLNLGFNYERLVGLEAEYIWLGDDQTHIAGLNAFLRLPLTESLEVRPFVGGGGWAVNNVRAMAQGGVEAEQRMGSFGSLVAGARYTYLDERDDLALFTLGWRITF